MATVNLGSIKFKWKGTYSGATAYTVDDVVEYNGSSYICILASTGNLPTNATYFEQMSSAGTNGTDLTTTLTTQGDILYRDGSGLQRLGAGTSGQALLTGGTGANPSWGSVGGGLLQVKTLQTGEYYTTTSTGLGTSAFDVTDLGTTFTPTSASSHILITGMIHMTHSSSYTGRGYITYNHSGISETIIKSNKASNTYNATFKSEQGGAGTSNVSSPSAINLHLAPNTTNEITFKTRIMTSNSGHETTINGTEDEHTNSDDGAYVVSSLTFWEISGDITPTVVNNDIGT
jgi:hypothetical protein